MLVVVCLKWGTPFRSEDANVLYCGVRRKLEEPFRFVCLTDDPVGLAPGIEALPIPDLNLAAERWDQGCWAKLSVFKPGLFADADLVLCMDIDLVVLRSLTPFLERARAFGGLHILREWNPALWSALPRAWRPDRGAQSSLFAWRPSEQHHIYTRFVSDQSAAYRLSGNDQGFIGSVASNRHYWPDQWAVSFRRSCVWYFPFNLIFRTIKMPQRAIVVVFHGRPRPWDLISRGTARWGTGRKFGFGPVSWIRAYWNQGLAAVPIKTEQAESDRLCPPEYAWPERSNSR